MADELVSLRTKLAQFVFDSLCDQETIAGCRIEVSQVTRKDTQVKVWTRADGPPEYFTVSVTHNR